MKDTEAAFKWIVGLLNTNEIPFQIGGGFAARIYGSMRPLADIDIRIPDENFDELLPEVKEFITYGPAQWIDAEWDLRLMTLDYQGQEIDIAGGTNIRMFNNLSGQWESAYRDLSQSHMVEVYGILVPVIPKADLVAYKRKMLREIDKQDTEMIEKRP